ncbi:MAG: hypothetical protein ACK6C0_15140 [Betaproteobacteria bacterium]|jgi:hypothetical protein
MKKQDSAAPRRSKRPNLSAISAAELQAELRRRTGAVKKLVRRHQALMAKAAELQAEIEAMGGSVGAAPAARAGKRARNSMSLVEALSNALKGNSLTIEQAMDAVRKAGYQSSSASFRQIVSQTLVSRPEFKRVARGVYTLK